VYCIIDIETTGSGIYGNKITEIAILKYDGHELVDEFTTLVNPECAIPYFITGLTGIDDAMVRNAPTLKEVANAIITIMKGTIFVAHNVNFDYNIIKKELKNIGVDFSSKKLCTVRLSRKLFPGYLSYSLGKLCSSLGIPLTDRHRARGDAYATMLLFHKLLRAQDATSVFKNFLNAKSQEATLPPLLPKSEFDKLPNTTGIYYFKDSKGKIIYVGKALDIKKRVLSHFYSKASKELALCKDTAYLDFAETGNELIALLTESAEIKQHYPSYNKAQKKSLQQYAIFNYEDRNGIIHLAINKIRSAPNPLKTFYSITDCRAYLENICSEFSLCAKYCHLQENVVVCSHFRIKQCVGICSDLSYVLIYNKMVKKAISKMKQKQESLLIKGKGRNEEELTLVLVENGYYTGFGYVPISEQFMGIESMEHFIKPQKNTLESQRIVQSYLVKNPTSSLIVTLGKVVHT